MEDGFLDAANWLSVGSGDEPEQSALVLLRQLVEEDLPEPLDTGGVAV
jgi:hypothetical protein